MALTATAIKNAKPRDKDYKLYDEKGLYLLVKKNGAKYWRFKYRFGGKEKSLALGVYSDVTLSMARAGRDDARNLLKKGSDPNMERKREKIIRQTSAETTFELVTSEWIEMMSDRWSPHHTSGVRHTLELDVLPYLGKLPLDEIDAPMLRAILDTVQKRGAYETAGRLRQRCSSIFRYGMSLGYCKADPADALKGIMTPPKRQNYAALTEKELPEFLEKIAGYNCTGQTRLALRLLLLTFVRTSELLGGRWEEIDFDEALWNIPPERMKKSRPHYVPLAKQTIEVLQKLYTITGHTELMLPQRSGRTAPMSNGTILRVIDRIGYRGRMTGHGFRSVASTILNDSGLFRSDVIEKQLAHEEENEIRKAYNRAKYMEERREMMQWWADKVDQLSGPIGNVIPLNILRKR